jgi:streptomycin 6-kinase
MDRSFTNSLPPELVKHVTSICGPTGEEWFDRLPQTIAELESKWSCEVSKPFPGVEFNFVAPAVMASGETVVLKIAPPYERTEVYAEAKYLRHRNGEGAVRFIAEDRERHAFLMERADPGEPLFKHFENEPEAIIQPAIHVLRSVLRKPPRDMADVGSLDSWFDNFRRYRETHFPQDYADKAFKIYERFSSDSARVFYLHGDFHPGNIVNSDRAQFLAIDPKGIIGHAGYDCAVFLNNLQWWQKGKPQLDGLLKNAISEFAEAFAMSEREVREWAFVYMVIGAWWTFDEMPEHYDSDLAELNVWAV